MSARQEQIDMEIRRELSRLLPSLKDPRIRGAGKVVSITRTETTRDLSVCKVYISVLESPRAGEGGGEESQVIAGLKSASGWLRRELGQALSVRHIPALVFVRDESIREGAHILDLLEHQARPKDGADGSPDDTAG